MEVITREEWNRVLAYVDRQSSPDCSRNARACGSSFNLVIENVCTSPMTINGTMPSCGDELILDAGLHVKIKKTVDSIRTVFGTALFKAGDLSSENSDCRMP